MKVDAACVQETHAPSHESIRKWFANSGYQVVSSSIKRWGTAILIHDSFRVSKVIKDDTGRFVQALVDFGDDQLGFVSLYALNCNPERNAFFVSLTGLLDLMCPVFVAGDFNSVLDNLLNRKRRNPYSLLHKPILCGVQCILATLLTLGCMCRVCMRRAY